MPFYVSRKGDTCLAMKVLDAVGDNARILIFSPTPTLVSAADIMNNTVYEIDNAVLGPRPESLRKLVTTLSADAENVGDLFQTTNGTRLVISNMGQLDFVDLQTGRLARLNTNVYAAFPSWRISIPHGDREEEIFSWPQA